MAINSFHPHPLALKEAHHAGAPYVNSQIAGTNVRNFPRLAVVALCGLSFGILSWGVYAHFNVSVARFELVFIVAAAGGLACGLMDARANCWSTALFALHHWIGELLMLGSPPQLGSTVNSFLISLAVLNGVPIGAAFAVELGHRMHRIT